jgi:hypothetical protein
VPPTLSFLPHRRTAFRVIGEMLAQLVQETKTVAERPGIPERVKYVAETVRLIDKRYRAVLGRQP